MKATESSRELTAVVGIHKPQRPGWTAGDMKN